MAAKDSGMGWAMKGILGVIFVLAPLLSAGASAQSAPPIGLWQGQNSGDTLWLGPDGSCAAGGSVSVAGICTWSATATGGVLTMTYQWTAGPATMAWHPLARRRHDPRE